MVTHSPIKLLEFSLQPIRRRYLTVVVVGYKKRLMRNIGIGAIATSILHAPISHEGLKTSDFSLDLRKPRTDGAAQNFCSDALGTENDKGSLEQNSRIFSIENKEFGLGWIYFTSTEENYCLRGIHL